MPRAAASVLGRRQLGQEGNGRDWASGGHRRARAGLGPTAGTPATQPLRLGLGGPRHVLPGSTLVYRGGC